MAKLFKKITIFIFSLLIYNYSYASIPTVNIITWWGYLNYSWIAPLILKKCGVKLSFDRYYNNQNFLIRFRKHSNQYDIAIFEAVSYPSIKNIIPKIPSSILYLKANKYNNTIKQNYYAQNFPHNIDYFFNSVTGLLWNKHNVIVKSNDSFSNIFKRSRDKLIVLPDAPLYFQILIQKNKSLAGDLSYKNFLRLFGNNTTIITNSFYKNIYSSSNFALSYQWSGEAINDYELLPLKDKKALYFSISPKYSFISSDILAQLNTKPSTVCVSNILTSKKFLNKLQNYTYYFSPYINIRIIKKPFFKIIYEQYLKLLPKLYWVGRHTKENRAKIQREWNYIKLRMRLRLNEVN